MLDIKLVRENPGLIKESLERRGDTEKIAWLDNLLDNDKKWRGIQSEANTLRGKRNKLTEQIAQLRRKGQDVSALVKEAEQIPEQIKGLEKETAELEAKIRNTLMELPNIIHESVPVGKDENDNIEVKKWGTLPQFDFQPKDHIDLAAKYALIDLERAAKVAGARFYYLRGDLVKLNQALIMLALDFIEKKGFNLTLPPYLMRREAVGGAVSLSDFEDVIYKIEGEDLYLLATSEHALLAQHMDEILDNKALPLKYAAVSPCFRKEAGAHGRDTKGIFRIHQFEKVEQFVFCKPEQSWEEHEKLIANAEELYQLLKIPYRVVNVCTGDLGAVAAKKYDLEAWMPGQGKYREIVSCSNCTSYQAVRSKVRYREKPDEPTKWVHTLNSTLVATERTIVAILENYQAKDGSINIPETLQAYMDGAKQIKPAN
ncbi:MAG TPA: serine--tRNA ligase [Candidatus Acidoferrales bacterium]|nr:serine--tRNA ligase [Candidatus Acidoferrales bacterium]